MLRIPSVNAGRVVTTETPPRRVWGLRNRDHRIALRTVNGRRPRSGERVMAACNAEAFQGDGAVGEGRVRTASKQLRWGPPRQVQPWPSDGDPFHDVSGDLPGAPVVNLGGGRVGVANQVLNVLDGDALGE